MRVKARLGPYATHESGNTEVKKLITKYSPFCEEVDEEDDYLTLYTEKPQYEELIHELSEKGIPFTKRYEKEFTKKELDAAEFLIIRPGYELIDTYNGNPETFFARECDSCHPFFTHQHSDLKVKKKYAGKYDFTLSREMKHLISPRLREVLAEEQCTGIHFRPVLTDGREDPVYYQLEPQTTLPSVHPMSKISVALGVDNSELTCDTCGVIRYIGNSTTPVYYPASIRETATDFNRSSEMYGIFIYPIRLTIVSQRVRQLFLKYKVKRARFEPIILVDEN